jgi:hypothetical protein
MAGTALTFTVTVQHGNSAHCVSILARHTRGVCSLAQVDSMQDVMPRVMQAGVSREECCPPLAIASLRTRGPLPPLAGGLGPFPRASLHGGQPLVSAPCCRCRQPLYRLKFCCHIWDVSRSTQQSMVHM